MKVNIGKYPTRLVCNIHTRFIEKKYGVFESNKENIDYYVETLEDGIQSVYNVLNWIWFDRQRQKINIRIDKHDTWGMDDTLAQIVLPMLMQLQATKHGSPLVEEEDLPPGFSALDVHQKWDWVMAEMIWAFEQKVNDEWAYEKFYDGQGSYNLELCKQHEKRMSNGFRLFGKYYQGLWD